MLERELQPRRKILCIADRFWNVSKDSSHLIGGFQMSFPITCQQPARCFERAMIANACEDIENLSLPGARVLHAIGGKQWQLQRVCQVNCALVERLFVPREMTLQLDIDIVAAKDGDKPIE